MYLLWKQFHLCFYKLKDSTSNLFPTHSSQQEQQVHPASTDSINKNKLLNIERQHHAFYDDFTTSSPDYSTSKSGDDLFFSSLASEEEYFDSWDSRLPDLTSIYASQRFFFSSPGRSNSIIESPDTRPSTTGTFAAARAAGGVRVPKYSLNPYEDFRCSMQEMIEARDQLMMDDKFEWDYLHELLLCYLSLNPTHTHKYIIQAFTDIIITLLSSSTTSSPASSCFQDPKNMEGLNGISRRLVFNQSTINQFSSI